MLVELFTSEGCSSCPPADAWISQLKESPDLWKKIVPVAFHVDYWNNLGWRDRFAKPEFTARQRRYVAAWGGDSVYTPGFVVNGKEWRDWFGNRVLWRERPAKVGIFACVCSERDRRDRHFRSRRFMHQPLHYMSRCSEIISNRM